MTTYAIGDVQGCYHQLKELLTKLDFKSDKDKLWFAGDIVNRGPDSLKTIRFIHSLEDNAVTVLGNHDLHLLALAHGFGRQSNIDTLQPILHASDSDSLLNWLTQQPLVHYQQKHHVCLVHAGIYPPWTLSDILNYNTEMQKILQSNQAADFFENMYGDKPAKWANDLIGWDRLRFITNCFTRMRYINDDLKLELKEKGAPEKQNTDIHPWFEFERVEKELNIIFGHWSTLNNPHRKNLYPLDTGCLWGGDLTALKINKKLKKFVRIKCPKTQSVL